MPLNSASCNFAIRRRIPCFAFASCFHAFRSSIVCHRAPELRGAHDSDEHYFFVAANLQVPYWQAAGAGFTKAAGQFKVRADFVGPNSYDPKAERDALDQAVQQKATGILLGCHRSSVA